MDATDYLEQIAYASVAMTALSLVELAVEITFVQWRALVILLPNPDGLTVSEIAERLGAGLSPASRLVGRMRRRGLVATSRDPADGRIRRVALTPTGANLCRQVLARRRERLEEIARAVDADDEHTTAFLGRLARAYAPYL